MHVKGSIMSVLVVASEMGCPSQVAYPWSSPWFIDRAPVEEALRLRESGKADEVVVMSVGDLKARILLRLALGMGADRAVVVEIEDGPSLEETSRLVTAVAAREHPDRILLGASAGEALARISSGSGRGSTTLTVSKLAQNACRYPTLIEIRKATDKRWDIITAAELRLLDKSRSIPHTLGVTRKSMPFENAEYIESHTIDEILEEARFRIAKLNCLPLDRVKLEARFLAD
jgi:electron transfer flavoprotein alpha/beta subunit